MKRPHDAHKSYLTNATCFIKQPLGLKSLYFFKLGPTALLAAMAEPAGATVGDVPVPTPPTPYGVNMTIGSIRAGRRVVVASRVVVANVGASSGEEESPSDEDEYGDSSSDGDEDGDSSSDVYVVGKKKKKVNGIKTKKIAKRKPAAKKRANR